MTSLPTAPSATKAKQHGKQNRTRLGLQTFPQTLLQSPNAYPMKFLIYPMILGQLTLCSGARKQWRFTATDALAPRACPMPEIVLE